MPQLYRSCDAVDRELRRKSFMTGFLLDESEVLAAVRILFPSDVNNCREILESVRSSEIKSAYRKRALQTHPDALASCDDKYRKGCSEKFLEVKNAYEILNDYLESKARGFYLRRQAPDLSTYSAIHQQFNSRLRESAGHPGIGFHAFIQRSFCRAEVPRKYLRFGEFLYYSGLIPWQTLARALVWQRKHRPRIGEIAQRWGWLTEPQIVSVLRNKHSETFLGELLLHLEIISPFQLSLLLWKQRMFQKPIGKYFLLQRLLTRRQIRRLLRCQRIHNLQE